ncbi:hypothetical protein Efla_000166 [Eimeria flavescens]
MGAPAGEGKQRLLPSEGEGMSTMPVEWGEGGKSFAVDLAGKQALALKTAHQEKTYKMFRKHEALIAQESIQIGLMHVLAFVLLSVAAAVYANVHVSFGLYKNQVSVAEEEVYAELLGMRNVTVTIQRLEMLSHASREYQSKALYVPHLLLPAYHRQIMASLFQINTRIIVGLEHIRSYDQTIRIATSCLYEEAASRYTHNCPLADVAAHVKAVDAQQEKALLKALMDIKLPLSEALDREVLERYPSSWIYVTQPSAFVHQLIGEGRFKEIEELSEKYVEELEQIVENLRTLVLWPPLVATPAVFGSVCVLLLLCFAVVTGVRSKRIYEASSVCQSAVFTSGKSIKTKMSDLAVFFVGFLEHLLLHNVHALNGLAAVLLACDRLTAYHHKLLKLQEKCLVDILTTAVNLMIYIETEVLVKNTDEKSVDLRSAIERSVELFRPKAAAYNIPISCTFANGCPSMAFIDEDQLRTTLTRTLAYVIDHSVEKGMGIDVYVNANASQIRTSKDRREANSPVVQLYDVRFEVKGHGVCMENTKAQMMVQTRGLIDRAGQGLRLLTCSRIAQSLGGFMQLQSSPSRGTFISFILRRKGRFSLEDLDSRFESLAGLDAKVLTLSLPPETKQFFTFLCKDIGVTCVNCFCLKQLMDELNEDNPDCPVLAVFLGDFVRSSANPSDRFSRSLSPREIFGNLLLHCESEGSFAVLDEIEDANLEKVISARETIPECLREDVNFALGVFNEHGLSKPVAELATAIVERASERSLSFSRRFAGLVDVSIELSNYYREMPGQRLIHQALEEQRRQTFAEAAKTTLGESVKGDLVSDAETRRKETQAKESLSYKDSTPPPKLRRDPVWWMGSTAALKVQIPPNHRIQAQFNLASVSCFDGRPYTMHDLLDWDFHVLSLPEPEAVRLCRDLLVYYADRACLGIRGEVIMNFCGALHANYLPNPYHNFYHALNVVQVLCLLLALPDVGARFTPTDFFVLSVAALGHDLGHPGFNNLFMQRNQCWPARLYSNNSILENYHAASLLQILRVPHMDLFASLSDVEVGSVRQRLINAIMWTDMAKHFDMVAKLDGKIQVNTHRSSSSSNSSSSSSNSGRRRSSLLL